MCDISPERVINRQRRGYDHGGIFAAIADVLILARWTERRYGLGNLDAKTPLERKGRAGKNL